MARNEEETGEASGDLIQQAGRVAIWVGAQHDELGLGGSDHDYWEGGGGSWQTVEKKLAAGSYSASYLEGAVASARELGVERTWLYAQVFDHAWTGPRGPVPGVDDAYFLGNFAFDRQARSADEPERRRDSLEGSFGAYARVWLEQVSEEAPVLRWLAERAGYPDDMARAVVGALPAEITRGSPSWQQGFAAELASLGARARFELVRSLTEAQASFIDAVVEGTHETRLGTGVAAQQVLPSASRAGKVVLAASAARRLAQLIEQRPSLADELARELDAVASGAKGAERRELVDCVVEASGVRLVYDGWPPRLTVVAVLSA